MKHFPILPLLIIATLVITSCGGQPAEPAISAEDIQSTAVSAAFTIVAETQAAIPTNTLPPPTETPTATLPPTDTAVVIPTIAVTSTNTPGGCSRYLDLGNAGPTHDTLIKNKTGGTVIVSLTLTSPNEFGECGWHPSPPDSGMVGLPSGNWYAYVYVTRKDGSQRALSTSFFVQPAQFDKIELCILKDSIVYSPSC